MKNLTAIICLTIAVLLGSAGMSYALPPCPSDQNQYYDNCFGTFTAPNGNKYVGEFRNGKRNGQGTYFFLADNRFKGDKAVGEWKDDKMHGQGAYTNAIGNKYVGEIRNGKKNGQGTHTFAVGDKAAGEWKDDKMHGQGTYNFAKTGNIYVGEFRNGKRHGQGTHTFASGNKYVGEHRNGKRNGQGTATFADGRIKEGIWKDDGFQYAQKSTPYLQTPTNKSAWDSSVVINHDPIVKPQKKYNTTQRHSPFKQKCQEIGFTPDTEQFGNCILRLMEMQSNNRPKTVIQNNSGVDGAVRALLEEQKAQREMDRGLELMKQGRNIMKCGLSGKYC
jgi:hypothetical protein